MNVFPYFDTFHVSSIKQPPKYINNPQMHFNIYNIFYSQYSHQHVSADIETIFMVMLL